MNMIKLTATVHGRVQGVHYRAFVQDAATGLRLVGIVRNEPDGTVQVVAEGTPDSLKELVEYLHEGSLLAAVESVSVDWGSASAMYDEISIAR